jgi:hypothetical protein
MNERKKIVFRRNEDNGGIWEVQREGQDRWKPMYVISMTDPQVRGCLSLQFPNLDATRYRGPNKPAQQVVPVESK